MKVRDRMHKLSEYKGRLTDACDALCPCRPCFNAHDCGTPKRVYDDKGRWVSNKYVPDMQCATRHNNGCSQPKLEPEHIYTSNRARTCKRCGAQRPRKTT